jgi:hypothetical protein
LGRTKLRNQFHSSLRDLWANGIDHESDSFIWAYTDRHSYSPGEAVDIKVSSTFPNLRVEIYRDGHRQERVFEHDVAGAMRHPAPPASFEEGCHWPALLSWQIPTDAQSGAYVVRMSAHADDREYVSHHLIIVRPLRRQGDFLLVAATCTWVAYNDWGGGSSYYGNNDNFYNGFEPRLAIARPWTRGMVWLPEGAPRKVSRTRARLGDVARYESTEWALLNGYSKQYSSAGWAMYERPFVVWAEKEGYAVDIVAQTDLVDHPELLDGYSCVAFVGHDEYWSWDMRDVVDRYVEHGGHVARFAGNFLWQIRIEDQGRRQVCYKTGAHQHDPVRGTPSAKRLTSAWEDKAVARPGAATFGVNALRGMYAGWGGFSPRSAKGFMVFREEHWAFAGTGLRYADMFGDDCNIFAYEVDGLDYAFDDGQPVPTFSDGAPRSVKILAMNWATMEETPSGAEGEELLVRGGDAQFRRDIVEGYEHRRPRGAGMIVNFSQGRGEVFTAGSCEWVNGLKLGDPATAAITRNVLDRYIAR